ncbi:hypothetical protein [Clavibacter tessellarius]|uniref:hypothetical protein n=1 Tax=Clavibacter tessellarius TaxID=31965 RepID=UPI00324632D5
MRAEQHRDVLFGQALATLQGVDGFANAGKDATGPGYWVAFTEPVAAAALCAARRASPRRPHHDRRAPHRRGAQHGRGRRRAGRAGRASAPRASRRA